MKRKKGGKRLGKTPAADVDRPDGETRSPAVTRKRGSNLKAIWDAVWKFAGGRSRDPEKRMKAEDIASETTLKVIKTRKWDPLYMVNPADIEPFARTSSKRALSNDLRAKRVRTGKEPSVVFETENRRSSHGNPELELDGNELLRVIQAGVRTMPEEFREVWYLCRVENYKVKDVAKYLGISENLASTRIGRAAVLMIAYVELHMKLETQEKQS